VLPLKSITAASGSARTDEIESGYEDAAEESIEKYVFAHRGGYFFAAISASSLTMSSNCRDAFRLFL
jgi:hypothetical protein